VIENIIGLPKNQDENDIVRVLVNGFSRQNETKRTHIHYVQFVRPPIAFTVEILLNCSRRASFEFIQGIFNHKDFTCMMGDFRPSNLCTVLVNVARRTTWVSHLAETVHVGCCC
jgi:hypothetical protein